MAIRDQSDSDTILSDGNRISLDGGAPSPRSIQLEEQVSPADEYALKIRKPYTITKQRERWSDEEHEKFLEALKLHGRAWRHIEEHVGTKTAVQIRSHAQKFFSKVVRESSNDDESSTKSIEIPPPRPKRKPMHPYPRKLAIPAKANLVKLKRSDSSEIENQSPTSVLSALCSDALGTVDSSKRSESSSPVSSAGAENSGDLILTEPSDFILVERSSSPAQTYASSNPDNQACVKLELSPQEIDSVKEGSVEASSTQCLKLFGKTVFVADPYTSPSPTSGQVSLRDVTGDATLTENSFPVKFSPSESECAPSTSSIGPSTPLCHVPTQYGRPRPNESSSSPLLPWGSSYLYSAFPSTHVHNPIPIKGRAFFNDKDSDDKETQKAGSSTGSNGESVSPELSGDMNLEVEAQSTRNLAEESGQRKLRSLFERRANSAKRVRGFVPYKRCLAERDFSSSTLTGEEREEQRTRLCL